MIKAATTDITKGWPHDAHRGFPPNLVAEHVKDANWQRVRLSMKGQTTAEKLRLLKQWRDACLFDDGRGGLHLLTSTIVQVDNYLGALRRGGQLDMNNMIRKYI